LTVYGRNSVEEAITAGLEIQEVLVQRGKADTYSGLLERMRRKGVHITPVDERTLDKESETRKHQGICARLAPIPNIKENEDDYPGWDAMNTVLALDGITDTGNLGAIIRSAALFGCDCIVLPNDNSARITPQTIRSSAGAIYQQKIQFVNNLNTSLVELQAEGFRVFGLAGDSGDSIGDADLSGKVCIVIGSEREGMRKSVRKNCDHLVAIPTTRKIDSLNASVACAVALWEVWRRPRVAV